jgi:amino acid adenylation domain-containing protein
LPIQAEFGILGEERLFFIMSVTKFDSTRARHPLSPAQIEIWLEQNIHPQSDQFIIFLSYVIPLELEVDRFVAAANWVFSHHEALFARLTQGPENLPELLFNPANAPHCECVDLSAESNPQAALQKLIGRQSHRLSQMLDACLSRPALVKTGQRSFCYYCHHHHIVIDGWGAGIVFPRIVQVYEDLGKGLEPKSEGDNYLHYLKASQQPLEAGAREKAVEFWQPLLASPIPSIPAGHAEGQGEDGRSSANVRLMLARELVDKVSAQAAKANASLFHALLLACGYLTARQYSLELFAPLLPILNRSTNYKETIGLFMELRTTPLPIDENAGVDENLNAIARRLKGVVRHYHLPAQELKRLYQSAGNAGPLGAHMAISYITRNFSASIDGVSIPMADVPPAHDNYPYTLYIYDTYPGRDIRLELAYQRRFMNQDEAELFLGRIPHLLEEFCAHPQHRLRDLDLVPPEESRRIASVLRREGESVAAQRLVIDDILERARLTPEAIAVETVDSHHSFCECVEKANGLASVLVRRHGVRPGDHVALLLPRSADLVSSYLAAMLAGATFVPLEPRTPDFRIRQICEDSGVKCLVTNAILAGKAHELNTPLLLADSVARDPQLFAPLAEPEQSAYIIYTSGSTGRPKGVEISHRALADHLLSWLRSIPLREGCERELYFHSPAFDASIESVFSPLMLGNTLVMAPHPQWTAYELPKVIVERGLNILFLPPPYLLEFLKYVNAQPERLAGHKVRLCVTGGEVVHAETAPLWDAVFGHATRLLCIYGPTETTVSATLFRLPYGYRAEPGESLPIGRVHPGRALRVVDEHNRNVPIGTEGELLIGGLGLARGYHNLPAETTACFVTLDDGRRYYRSGDIVRLKTDGNLLFRRRWDQQVKIRGFRVELGEIEACLLTNPAVKQCAVLAGPEAEDKQGELQAYVALVEGSRANQQTLRDYLLSRLPDYMVPLIFLLDTLPTGDSGKIDRKALRSLNIVPAQSRPDFPAAFSADGPVQEYLAMLWKQALGKNDCSARGDFFEMGGHSLLAAKLVAKIGKAFRVEFPFSAFFDKPTIPDTERTLEQLVGNRTKLEKIARLRLELSKLSSEEINARLTDAGPASR